MQMLTAIHAADVPPEQLSVILAEYLALEELRGVRREFLPQLAVVGLFVATLGVLGILTALQWISSETLLVAAGGWLYWLVLRRDRKLRRHLAEIPGCATRSVRVRKS